LGGRDVSPDDIKTIVNETRNSNSDDKINWIGLKQEEV
jgi:hypothetical protein